MTSVGQQQSPPQPYTPPSASEIARRQNEDDALRPLYAQRKLYSKSKRYLAFRRWGMGAIAITAPLIALKWPPASLAVGAVAAGWLAIGRHIFIKLEDRYNRQGAAVQEQFDTYVFDMPEIAVRPELPSLEDISRIAGSDTELRAKARGESLLDWYPVDSQNTGLSTVAINQRANATYSEALLKVTSRLWMGLIVGWTITLCAISMAIGLSFTIFLLAVFLPLASPIIELFEYWRSIRLAASERGALGKEIEDKLKHGEVTGEELIIWQTRMYDLRVTMPQVPNLLYKWQRKTNERAMKTAAGQLSDRRRRP
jgi:hypothetical protein